MLNTTLADAKEENSRLGWESFPLLVESLEDEEEEQFDAQFGGIDPATYIVKGSESN